MIEAQYEALHVEIAHAILNVGKPPSLHDESEFILVDERQAADAIIPILARELATRDA